jgi:hypothetical protein
MVTVGYILHVTTDDRHSHTQYLLAFGVNLKESLTASFLVLFVTLQVTDDCLTLQKTLLLLFVEEVKVILIELWIEEYIDSTFRSAFEAESCASGFCLAILGSNIIGNTGERRPL